MKALFTIVFVAVVGIALASPPNYTVIAGRQNQNRRPRGPQPPPLPPRNSNGPGSGKEPTGPITCPGLRDCTPQENELPTQLHVEFPGPNGMTLHGHLYVPGVNTRAELDALSKSTLAPQGRVTENTPVREATVLQLKKLFPAMIYNHGSEPNPKGVPQLAKLYVDNGYIFFAPDRHGQGLSKDAGPYHLDEQNQYQGKPNFGEMDVKLHEKYNKDVIAAVEWFKKQPYVDRNRIMMTGISFGGIQTLLAAEKDPGIRGYVPFAPAAESWSVPELRTRLIDAVRNEKAPMFIIQAQGDYNLGPIETLGPLLHQKGDPHKWRWKLYPQFGCTNAEAHGRFAMQCDGIAIWKSDVLEFISGILE